MLPALSDSSLNNSHALLSKAGAIFGPTQMLRFSDRRCDAILALCELRGHSGIRLRSLSPAVSQLGAVNMFHAATRAQNPETPALCVLRLPRSFDTPLGLAIMPHQDEKPDSVFQFAECATKGKLLRDRISIRRDRIADTPLRQHRI